MWNYLVPTTCHNGAEAKSLLLTIAKSSTDLEGGPGEGPSPPSFLENSKTYSPRTTSDDKHSYPLDNPLELLPLKKKISALVSETEFCNHVNFNTRKVNTIALGKIYLHQQPYR